MSLTDSYTKDEPTKQWNRSFSYVYTFFCSKKFARLLASWLKMVCIQFFPRWAILMIRKNQNQMKNKWLQQHTFRGRYFIDGLPCLTKSCFYLQEDKLFKLMATNWRAKAEILKGNVLGKKCINFSLAKCSLVFNRRNRKFFLFHMLT